MLGLYNFPNLCLQWVRNSYILTMFDFGGVAQLVRASACHAEGRGFKSHHSRHLISKPISHFGVVPMTISVNIIKLEHAKDLPLPVYATEHSAGMDLLAANDAEMIIKAGEVALVPTGIAIALPVGMEAQIRPRSGLAAKNGITVLNSPGTIDADYRGEIKVILINHSKSDFTVERGMRIAQMVISQYQRIILNEVETLDQTDRGSGGFGSTGVV